MSSASGHGDACTCFASRLHDVKGKGRATETTPLLPPPDGALIIGIGGSSARYHAVPPPPPSPSPRQRRANLRNILVKVFFGTLTLSVVAVVSVAVLTWSYARRAEQVRTDKALRAIFWHGPQDIEVLGVGEGEGVISLRVSGKVGVDADIIMGWDKQNNDMSIWEGIWRDIGRWGVTILKEVTVSLGNVTVYPQQLGSGYLFKARTQPVIIPITSNPPAHGDWLTPISFNLTLQLSTDAELLERFVTASWETGAINVRVGVDEVHVQAGRTGRTGWRRLLRASRRNLESYVHMRIPSIPGIPEPRPPIDKLLNLVSYSLIPTVGHNLTIAALATVPNPLPECHFVIPPLPYVVSLLAPSLSPLPIATGRVEPKFTSSNITLPIQGTILRIPSTSTSPHPTILLSHFLTLFLSGTSPSIRIMTPLLPHIHLDTVFPVPKPPPKVLRDVTIKRMMLTFGKDRAIFASGIVWARLVMPRGINVPVNATDIWPDVLVFDGELPEDGSYLELEDVDVDVDVVRVRPTGIHIPLPTWLPNPLPHRKPPNPIPPTKPPSHHDSDSDAGGGDGDGDGDGEREPPSLPNPVPERAFARIHPDAWLPALTIPDTSPDNGEHDMWTIMNVNEGDEHGWSATVISEVHDVPLHVLPGREAQFRSFVSKVLLSKDGALAGVKGTSAVRAAVPGLLAGKGEHGSRLELRGLPFEGVVRIGKKGIGRL